MMKKSLIILLLLCSCSIQTKEDFETQARGQIERLSRELQTIHDLETLKDHEKSLKKKFNQLTDLMVNYHQFLEKHPEAASPPSDPLVIQAAFLKEALSDVLKIEGAEHALIDIEKDSFIRLTLMEEGKQKGVDPFKKRPL